jgi:hypothetical protein
MPWRMRTSPAHPRRRAGWSTRYAEVEGAGDFLDARKARLGDVLEMSERRR